jgi:DNA-binding NarL/FixJ family response regulator
MTLRVLIVDDHHVVREGLALLLDSVDDVVVAGQAASGEEAVRLAADLRPDVVLLGLEVPGTA